MHGVYGHWSIFMQVINCLFLIMESPKKKNLLDYGFWKPKIEGNEEKTEMS